MLRITISSFLAFSLAVLLGGCATQNVDQSYAPRASSGKGLVVGSVSQTKIDMSSKPHTKFYFVPDIDEQSFSERLLASPNEFVWIRSEGFNPVEFQTIRSEFDDVNGKVFAVELSTGKYKICNFVLSTSASNKGHWKFREPHCVYFAVNPGEVVYIGNLHMEILRGKNFLGINIISGGIPSVTDRKDRDLSLILQRYQNLRSEDVEVRVIDDTAWKSATTVGDEDGGLPTDAHH